MKTCHKCGAPWESSAARVPGVKEVCEQCSAYLHCCLNCTYYDPSKSKQCYIPNVELVSDKAGANFCDEFEFADASERAARVQKDAAAREQLDALFGDDDAPEKPDVDAFNKLFGE